MHAKKNPTPRSLWSSKWCVYMVCVRLESLVTSPLRCSWMWRKVSRSTYLYHQCILHGRITILFLSSKLNHFEIAISCFDKFCVGNSTLTLIAALCGPLKTWHTIKCSYVYSNAIWNVMWTYRRLRNKTSKRKVFLNPYHTRGRLNRNAVGMTILCPFLDIPHCVLKLLAAFQLHSNFSESRKEDQVWLDWFAHALNFPILHSKWKCIPDSHSNFIATCVLTPSYARFQLRFETFHSYSWWFLGTPT